IWCGLEYVVLNSRRHRQNFMFLQEATDRDLILGFFCDLGSDIRKKAQLGYFVIPFDLKRSKRRNPSRFEPSDDEEFFGRIWQQSDVVQIEGQCSAPNGDALRTSWKHLL